MIPSANGSNGFQPDGSHKRHGTGRRALEVALIVVVILVLLVAFAQFLNELPEDFFDPDPESADGQFRWTVGYLFGIGISWKQRERVNRILSVHYRQLPGR